MPERLSPTLSIDELRTVLSDFNQLGFVTHFGVRTEIVDELKLRTIVAVRDFHRGGLQGQAVNGGVIASMFDLALGLPGLLRAHPDKRTATVQLSMSFMRAVKGDVLIHEAWIAKAGSGLLFTEAQALDGEGRICATASGVVRMLEGFTDPRTY